MFRNYTMAKWIGLALKITLGFVVGAFLGRETMNFANFIFPPEQWYFAYSVFGLTMGAFLVYMYLLLKDADTSLQKTVALIMMFVGLIGELATAGFGMQIEGMKRAGWQMTPQDFDFMVLAIRIMLFVHGIALMLYWFGDRIFEIIEEASGKDINRDGRIGKQNNSSNNQPRQQQKSKQPQQQNPQRQYPNWELPELLVQLGMNRSQAEMLTRGNDVNQFYNALKVNGIEKIDISRSNFRRLYSELANGHKVNP